MSKDNSSKVPVRFIEGNEELLKAQGTNYYEDIKGKTDYVNDTDTDAHLASGKPVSSYRTPLDRVNGNEMFRRYLDGRLDVHYAVDKVIESIHRYKQHSVPLFTQEAVALQAIFPAAGFDGGIDTAMAAAVGAVNLKLTPQEILVIRHKVAAHLAEELNWNAGMGGGSVPGRSDTYESQH